MNLVESWFAQLTRRRLRHGVFTSVDDLQDTIDHWAAHWNDDPTPFTSAIPATDILAKVQRARTVLTKSATHH